MRFIEKLKHLLSIGKAQRILSVQELKQHPLFQKAKKSLLGRCQKTRGVSVVALSFAFIAFGAAATAPGSPPDKDNITVTTVKEDIPLPSLSDQLEKLRGEKQFFAREDKIRPGDTLGTLLTRLGVDDRQAFQFIKSDEKAKAFLQAGPFRLKLTTRVLYTGCLLRQPIHRKVSPSSSPEPMPVLPRPTKWQKPKELSKCAPGRYSLPSSVQRTPPVSRTPSRKN